MNNAELVNYFYSFFGSKKTVIGTTLFDGGTPSQADKPSPHSSYTTSDLWKRARKAFPEDNIRVFEVANTNSMEPLFDDNCQVITETTTPAVLALQPLRCGDIVIYTAGEGLIIHRLKENRLINGKEYWLLAGDNNFVPDGWVETSRIAFRVVGILYGRQVRTND